MVDSCSEVAKSDAEKESEARCKAMLDKLISEVKKQTVEMEDLAVRMNEIAVGLKSIVQPQEAPVHALPPPGTAPTTTCVTAVDHAVAAATPRAEATLAPESPTKCSTSGPDPNAGYAKVAAVPLLSRGATTALRAHAEPVKVSSTKLFDTGERDTVTPTRCSTACRGCNTDMPSTYPQEVAPTPPLTDAMLDAAVIVLVHSSGEIVVDESGNTDTLEVLRPVTFLLSSHIYPVQCALSALPIREGVVLSADCAPWGMTSYQHAAMGQVEAALAIDGHDNSWTGYNLRFPDFSSRVFAAQVFPAMEVFGEMGDKNKRKQYFVDRVWEQWLEPWPSFRCNQGGVPWMPPWPSPQGHGTLLQLLHKQAGIKSWMTTFINAEMGGLNSLVLGVILVEQLLLLYWDYGKIQSLFWVMVGLVWAGQGVEAMDLFQLVISSGIGFDVVRLSEFFIACAGVKGYFQGLQVHSSNLNYEMESKEQKPTHQRNVSVDLTSSKVSAETIEAKLVSERPTDDENEVVENGIVNGIADAKKPGSPNTVRLYSIAPTRYGDSFDVRTASLCVHCAVYYDPETGKEDPSKKGICSNFLCDSKPGDKIQITGPSGKIMFLPEDDPNATHIMIATGTVVAPFRGYLCRMFLEDVPTFNFGSLAWLFLGVANTDNLLYEGNFTAEAGQFNGLPVLGAGNAAVVKYLDEQFSLILEEPYKHKYPYDWRSKEPTILRATEQWFASVDGFRNATMDAIRRVTWIPSQAENRIVAMTSSRSDGCISRQRTWGVPIPVFSHVDSQEPLITDETIEHIKAIVSKRGSDAWWYMTTEELLPDKYRDKASEYRKGTDTMDVWFDSGFSWAAVLAKRDGFNFPADIYLEGSDQHRGWFQSSLLTSIATTGKAPYSSVITHGFVLDEKGFKMSKSLGNVVDPEKVIIGGKNSKEEPGYGADVLRLWVSSVDYTGDVLIGPQILRQMSDMYRKLRGTMRFLLSNLHDWKAENSMSYNDLPKIDKYALFQLENIVASMKDSYENYQFYKIYQILQRFAVVDLSNFYFDVAKDRLYVGGRVSFTRKSCQTVLTAHLLYLVRAIAPIMPHLAEDVWQNLPFQHILEDGSVAKFVFDLKWPDKNEEWLSVPKDDVDFLSVILELRSEVNKILENARTGKLIGSSLDAKVYLHAENADTISRLKELSSATNDADALHRLFITSQVEILPSLSEETTSSVSYTGKFSDPRTGEIWIGVTRADGGKCERCWNYTLDVGSFLDHPTLCVRCHGAIDLQLQPLPAAAAVS